MELPSHQSRTAHSILYLRGEKFINVLKKKEKFDALKTTVSRKVKRKDGLSPGGKVRILRKIFKNIE